MNFIKTIAAVSLFAFMLIACEQEIKPPVHLDGEDCRSATDPFTFVISDIKKDSSPDIDTTIQAFYIVDINFIEGSIEDYTTLNQVLDWDLDSSFIANNKLIVGKEISGKYTYLTKGSCNPFKTEFEKEFMW